MNFFARVAKVFAVLFLIFVNLAQVPGQGDSIYSLPAGTRIHLKMDAGISSKVSRVDDTFTAVVNEAVRVRDLIVLHAGTTIEGRVTRVSAAAAGGRNGSLEVRFESIRFSGGRKREIDGVLVTSPKRWSSRTSDLLVVLGATAAGAVFGTATKADNGTWIGALLGAGTGVGVAVFRKGKEASISTNEMFEIELKREVSLPASDY